MAETGGGSRRRFDGRALPQREHRIDQIVPRPLLAELHLQAVGEEGEDLGI